MKIAIMSDSHDHWDNLTKAIQQCNDAWCEQLLFAGDVMAPGKGISTLKTFQWPVHMVFWNNDGDVYKLMKNSQWTNITIHGDVYEDTIDGIKIVMNHYKNIITRAAKSGDYDLCIYGHDHLCYEAMVGQTLLVNPGSILGDRDPASFVIYDTQTKSVAKIVL